MSVTEASHTQIPSRGMRAWKKKTSLWQWRTARCGSQGRQMMMMKQHERLCHCQCDANNAYAVTELSATV